MNLIIITNLILCAFFFRFGVEVWRGYKKHKLAQTWEKEAKRALRFLFLGIALVGLFALATWQFDFIRDLGFSLISKEQISVIRGLMNVFLGTTSVYVALGVMTVWTLILIQVCFLFTIVGIFLVKRIYLTYCVVETEELYSDLNAKNYKEVAVPYVNRRICFNLAHLRN